MSDRDTEINKICDKLASSEISELEAAELLDTLAMLSDLPIEEEEEEEEEDSRKSVAYVHRFSHDMPYLTDHIVFGHTVLLGVTHCSLAIEAFKQHYPNRVLNGLNRFVFFEPIIVPKNNSVEISVAISYNDSIYGFEIRYLFVESGLTGQVATGEYLVDTSFEAERIDLNDLDKRAIHVLEPDTIYAPVKAVVHQASLFTLRELYVLPEESIGKLHLSDRIRQTTPMYFFHPALLDGACMCAMSSSPETATISCVPFFVKEIHLSENPIPTDCICKTKITKQTHDMVSCDMWFCDESGQIIAQILGFTFKQIDHHNFFKISPQSTSQENPVSTKKEPSMSYTAVQGNKELNVLVESYIQSKIALHLNKKSEQIDMHTNFMDLGLESMPLMDLARDIESEIAINLYPTVFFEYATISDLAKYFATEYDTPFERYFNQAVETQKAPSFGVSETVSASTSTSTPSPLPQAPVLPQDPLPSHQDIAVIGMSGRFPKSEDLNQFFDHIDHGLDFIEEIPLSRWDYRRSYDPNGKLGHKIYCKWGSFIKDVDHFDADFFNISEPEARAMDPQIRLLLEVMYEASDDAGYSARIRGSSTGVYVGSSFQDYGYRIADSQVPTTAYHVVGNSNTMVANRASYYFNLSGPSLMLDTSCSSSLVALHLACQALRNRECETAFVAGVNLILSPRHYEMMCSVGAFSESGRCHTFDSAADGYVPAEAIVAVLLKPLHAAIADGDPIHAVIKGSAVRHGGHTSAVTAPSVTRETEVILSAWSDAKIDPRTLSYIEAHGTGTKLGDPIEIQAIQNAFLKHTADRNFCAIGSLKGHMGHAEAAAGIASLVKIIMSLKAKRITAMPCLKTLNPYIQLNESPLYINETAQEWASTPQFPRRAGINSFGFGGTYAHVVVEEFIKPLPTPITRSATSPYLVLVSAKTEANLNASVTRLKTYISNALFTAPTPDEAQRLLANIAYTLQVGRESHPRKVAFIVSSLQELGEKLAQFLSENKEAAGILMGSETPQPLQFIIEGAAGRVYIEALLQEKNISTLARLWIWGAQIDWQLMYPFSRPEKISLPAYPFSKKAYWFEHQTDPHFVEDPIDMGTRYHQFVQNQLESLEIGADDFLQNPLLPHETRANSETGRRNKKRTKKQIKAWIYTQLSKVTGRQQKDIDPLLPFEAFDIDSIDIITLYRQLGQFLGWDIPPGAFQDARTIDALVDYVFTAKEGTFQDQMAQLKETIGNTLSPSQNETRTEDFLNRAGHV